VNTLWAGQSRVSILLEVIDFYILHNIQTSTVVHAVSWGSFLGVKWLGCEFNHSSPPSVEVKNEWSYTSTLPYMPS